MSCDGARRELIPLAKAKNVTVVLGAIVRLPSDMPEQLERLYALQRESGFSMLELTIRYLLADRDVTAILVGAATPAEIGESVEAAEKGALPADLHHRLEEMGTP
jgi:aryl-alcohol dehydrogenase-like predicted oxidoreductase